MKNLDIQKLRENFPECPGIMGKEEFFNAAVFVPIVNINNNYSLLFEKRTDNIQQGGEICFPGGQFDHDKDHSFEDTAIRETIEELGVEKDQLSILGKMDTLIAPMGASVDTLVGILDINDLNELTIEKNEVQRVFLVPLSFFKNNEPEKYSVMLKAYPSYTDKTGKKSIFLPAEELGLPKRYSSPWGGLRLNVYVYRAEGEIIWGLTAKIIYYLMKMIKPILPIH